MPFVPVRAAPSQSTFPSNTNFARRAGRAQVKRKFDLVAASREQKQQRAASAPAAAAAAPAAAPTVAAQAAAAPAGLPPAPCKISIDEPMLFKVVNTYTRETRTSAKMTDTVIADGRGAFARVVEPIPPQHQVKHPRSSFRIVVPNA